MQRSVYSLTCIFASSSAILASFASSASFFAIASCSFADKVERYFFVISPFSFRVLSKFAFSLALFALSAASCCTNSSVLNSTSEPSSAEESFSDSPEKAPPPVSTSSGMVLNRA